MAHWAEGYQCPCSGCCCQTLYLPDRFIELFGRDCIREILADRKFGNVPMVDMLLKRNMNCTIRARANHKVHTATKNHGYKAKPWFRLAQEKARKRIRYKPEQMIADLRPKS